MIRKQVRRNIGLKITTAAVFSAIAVLAIFQYRWAVSSGEKIISDLAKSYNFRIFGTIAQELGHINLFNMRPPQAEVPGEIELRSYLEEMDNQLLDAFETQYLKSMSYSDLRNGENYEFDGSSWKPSETLHSEVLRFLSRPSQQEFRDFNLVRDLENPDEFYIFRNFKGEDFLIVLKFDMIGFVQEVIIPAVNESFEGNSVKWQTDLPPEAIELDERSYRFSPAGTILSNITGHKREYYLSLPYSMVPILRFSRDIHFKSEMKRNGDSLYMSILSETGDSLYFERELSIAFQWLTGLLLLSGIGAAYSLILYQKSRLSRLRQREKEFVATITHELRTPLTVIHSAADNIQSGILTPDRLMQYGDLIKDQSGRLSSMIEGILLFSRIEGKAEKAPPLNSMAFDDLKRDLEIFAESVKKGSRKQILFDFASLPASAVTDRETLELILTNLIVNSMRHAYGADEAGDVRINGHLKLPSSIVFTVEDDGYGISGKEKKHIFEPFFRGDRSMEMQIKGSGLGLFLVNRKIKLMGGSIKIESPYIRPDGKSRKGSRFTITLPFQKENDKEK